MIWKSCFSHAMREWIWCAWASEKITDSQNSKRLSRNFLFTNVFRTRRVRVLHEEIWIKFQFIPTNLIVRQFPFITIVDLISCRRECKIDSERGKPQLSTCWMVANWNFSSIRKHGWKRIIALTLQKNNKSLFNSTDSHLFHNWIRIQRMIATWNWTS